MEDFITALLVLFILALLVGWLGMVLLGIFGILLGFWKCVGIAALVILIVRLLKA